MCTIRAGSPTGHSLRLCASSAATVPSSPGMGSPWGSRSGCPRCASSFATSERLRVCSAFSAALCSRAIGMSASSARWRSHSRCARTTLSARRSPLGVRPIPEPPMRTQPLRSRCVARPSVLSGVVPRAPASDSRLASLERCCHARTCFRPSSACARLRDDRTRRQVARAPKRGAPIAALAIRIATRTPSGVMIPPPAASAPVWPPPGAVRTRGFGTLRRSSPSGGRRRGRAPRDG